MKRDRETTTPAEVGKPSPAKTSNALEEIRAKLEQARLKKIAAEERLLRQKQQQQQQDPKTQNSKREAQQALDRARSRLQGALQNRERALQQNQWNRKKHSRCAPISALDSSFTLKITNILQSGPREMVYHYEDSLESPASTMGLIGSRMALEVALGGKQAVEALHKGSYNAEINYKDTANSSDKSRKDATNENQKQTASLLQRKIQLQNELLALKEKLEMKSSQEQKQKGNHQKDSTLNPAQDGKTKNAATKEGLERRKAEAQTIMDISYWKHFVSKQEVLLEQVTTKLKTTDKSYKECLQTRHATNKAIARVQQNLEFLQQRQTVVEEGMLSSIQALLQARQQLHDQTAKEGGKAHE